MSNFQKIIQKIKQARQYLQTDAKTIMGVEAVNHFKESFRNQGFTDKSLQKWEEVERRKPQSDWHGFQYGSTTARPGQKKRNKQSMTNYSPAATRRPILSGETQELLNSISWKPTPAGIVVFSNVKYAKIQNQGGKVKIFGKASGNIPARKFMGPSEVLRKKIQKQIVSDLQKYLR